MSVTILQGDCVEVMRGMADSSVHAVVCDPPYEIGFMGKGWDTSGVANRVDTWAEVLRVLKPGGHILAFSGTRTYHRMACAIEDAGFEMRDQIGWAYGQGFPKSRNLDGDWQGWGTALKPAWEPICVARKPLVGTVAQNVAAHGTGALNIDGCRVSTDEQAARTGGRRPATHEGYQRPGATMYQDKTDWSMADTGRWPANIIHDGSEEVLAAFPDSKGQQGYTGPEYGDKTSINTYGDYGPRAPTPPRNDSGSAARFFYCAKASRADRNDGLDGMEEKPLLWSSGEKNPGSFQSEGTKKAAQNNHPTVKPTALMQYLCRLVTPPGGIVLDPFMGSGSTGRGAVLEGFSFIGIELNPEYIEIARRRIAISEPKQAEDAPLKPKKPQQDAGPLFGGIA